MARKKDNGEITPSMDGLTPETARPRAREVLTEPARDPMIVAFYGGSSAYPTVDGRSLSFGDEVVRGQVRLRFDLRDEASDLPGDFLAADLSVADSEGRAWSITSRFSSEVLLIHMIDLSSDSAIAAIPKKGRAAFDEDLLLQDVRFSSDDRFYRRFEAGTRMVDVQFKYTTISFDLAASRDEDDEEEPILTTLKVRLNEDGLFDAKGKSVGPLVFEMKWLYLFRHNTIAPGLSYSPLPLPMAFRLTGDRAEPQAGVRIVEPGPT